MCGSNPFYAHSHFSDARDTGYKHFFTKKNITNVIKKCVESGIDCLESPANEHIYPIFETIKNEQKGQKEMHFIGTTRVDETSEIKSHGKKLDFLIERKADVCIIHSQFVDRPRRGDEIKGLQKMVDKIHENGLIAGISTHRVSTIELCEKNNYGIDVYMFPLNTLGFSYPGYDGSETIEERISIIQNVNKPFIIIKSLAAGRIPPAEGLEFVFNNIKNTDFLSIGFGSEKEVEETLRIIDSITHNTESH